MKFSVLPIIILIFLIAGISDVQLDTLEAHNISNGGYAFQRALEFYEAWFEASISCDEKRLEHEWLRLLNGLKSSRGLQQGKIDVTVLQNLPGWKIRLSPVRGPVYVLVTPEGAQLLSRFD